MIKSLLGRVYRNPRYLGRSVFPDTFLGAGLWQLLLKVCHPVDAIRRHRRRTGPMGDGGYLVMDWHDDEDLRASLDHCRSVVADGFDIEQKSFLLSKRLDPEKIPLASSPRLLQVIGSYLGSEPILQSARIWHSPNEEMHAGRSQEYHLDSEDFRQVKVFAPIEEVTHETGPLTLIPADESAKIYNALWKDGLVRRRNIKLADEVVYAKTDHRGIEILGGVGTLMLVDTCRCYHFGSRPAPKPRTLLYLHFTTAFSLEMPLWGRRDGAAALANRAHERRLKERRRSFVEG